ncbi:MAG: L,D-transpeptidase family protein [Rhodobacteraceae bacterium]|nr:L,D-transpeptidase family protein [Paracoccaceae bacterium]
MRGDGLGWTRGRTVGAAMVLSLGLCLSPVAAREAAPPFARAVSVALAEDEALASFYAARAYRTLWTGAQDAERRAALFAALDGAAAHGLPIERYDAAALREAFAAALTEGDRGRLEVRMTRAFLTYASDVATGVLDPEKADAGIHRTVTRLDPLSLLALVEGGNPQQLLRELPPDAPEYARLMKEKLQIEAQIARGGWGSALDLVPLASGAEGAAVVRLRDRLVAMGYLRHSVTAVYDREVQAAVQRFQMDHGLTSDGEADEATLAEMNVSPEDRVKSIVVAMERLRWMHDVERGARHIWVNLPDFSAKIVDHGKVTFQTRSVIGKNVPDQRSPEFSDEMDHMVINPSWGVPRSIIVKEYLPLLQRNPNAVSHLQVIDRNGRVVPRGAVNFASYSARSFPFGLRQPPSDGNALGKVKFMFPNPYNIYLHDTPAKDLFDHEVRAYSHGCIRLGDPFDFAYALLAAQSADPKALFHEHLDSDRETVVRFDEKLPVHLVYFTAWPTAKGEMTYRRDIYGRDARLFEALSEAGVALGDVQG